MFERLVDHLDRVWEYPPWEPDPPPGFQIGLFNKSDKLLFRDDEYLDWILFTTFFLCALAADAYFCRPPKNAEGGTSLKQALLMCAFWISLAFCYAGYIYGRFGGSDCSLWISGYILEWMLSFDNLFVFHTVFRFYKTPAEFKHRPLFYGIFGAVFFRLLFIFVWEYIINYMSFAYVAFGCFLIYTGVKTLLFDEDGDEDVTDNFVVRSFSKVFSFVDFYAADGSFFVDVGHADDGTMVLEGQNHAPVNKDKAAATELQDFSSKTSFLGQNKDKIAYYRRHATILVMVVLTIEVADLVFAVDSVSAIVAQVNDFFLAYTSTVFAMLGLRAAFFVIEALSDMFVYLNYGVGVILIFIGVKLCLQKLYTLSPVIMVLILVATLLASIVASVVFPPPPDDEEQQTIE